MLNGWPFNWANITTGTSGSLETRCKENSTNFRLYPMCVRYVALTQKISTPPLRDICYVVPPQYRPFVKSPEWVSSPAQR
jgi:hypothetical protein